MAMGREARGAVDLLEDLVEEVGVGVDHPRHPKEKFLESSTTHDGPGTALQIRPLARF